MTTMAREKPDYRANLELIKEHYPGKAVLNMKEACKFLRRDRRTLLGDKAFPAVMVGGQYSISIAALARYLSI